MLLDELNFAYAELIKTEGTFLTQQESLRYFISMHAVPVLVVALNRARLMGGLGYGPGIWRDEKFWYLPSAGPDSKLALPLAKVMRWAYTACNLSQKQFHCPGKLGDAVSPAQQQNLDNAVNWTRGKTIPSLPALLVNFKESFAAQGTHAQPIDPAVEQSILVALTYARVASYVAKGILKTYGSEYLNDVCAQIRQLTDLQDVEVLEFLRQVDPIMRKHAGSDKAGAIWVNACADHERFMGYKLKQVAELLMQFRTDHLDAPIPPDMVDALTRKYGRFAVHANVDQLTRQDTIRVPPGFPDLLGEGLRLRQTSTITMQEIAEFEQALIAAGLHSVLCWLPPWLRGIYHYRRNEFDAAYPHYDTAFDLAKYRAGRFQYDLVNQFVEIAAKNRKEIAFDKGIDWALYIGLEIRWLRDKEPSQENRDIVRCIMERADYEHQL
jgi:hypothetical protein